MQKTLTKIFTATVQLNALNMAARTTSETAKAGLQITTDICYAVTSKHGTLQQEKVYAGKGSPAAIQTIVR